MKLLLLFLVSILSISQLPAQVKTGGGGGPDIDTPDQKLKAHEAQLRLKYIFADLSKELIKIEKNCNGRKSVPAGYDFVDSFYTLSLKKHNDSTPLNEADCKPTKKLAKCLYTKNLKKIMAEINQTPGAVLFSYLKKQHKLDEKEATIMLKFFTAP